MNAMFQPVHEVRLTQGRYSSAAIGEDGSVQFKNDRGEYIASEPASDYTREIAKLAIALRRGEGAAAAAE